MPLISRFYVVVPLPKGAGVGACVWALALLLYSWGLTRIAGLIVALAIPTPAKWVFFGVVASPLLGCTPMFLSYCYVAIKANLRRASHIEIRKPTAR